MCIFKQGVFYYVNLSFLSKCKDIQNTCFVVPISQSPIFSVKILLLFFFFVHKDPFGNKLLALMGHPWEISSYKHYLIHI